jgi:hypothetical protein
MNTRRSGTGLRWSARSLALALLASGLVGLTIEVACGCSGSEGGDALVTVGSISVSESQVRHWTRVLAAAEPASQEGVVRERVLGFLTHAAWLAETARTLRLGVSPAEAREKLELLRYEQVHGMKLDLLPADAVIRRLLIATSGRPSDGEWLMRLELLTLKVEKVRLKQAAAEVPRNEVKAYYAAHKSEFVEPAVRDLEIIGNTDEAKVRRAKREIEAGKPFLTVARYAGEDIEAPNALQHLIRGTEEPPFERHIFEAKLHVLSGPIKQELTYIFEVLEAKPDRQQTLAQAEAKIRMTLAPKRVASVLLPAFEAEWRAKTRCRTGFAQGCSSR